MTDQISSLPEEVITHVLSFLTTKEAALTSVLAKKWRKLFASVPILDIDDSVFLHPEEGKQDREDIIKSFMRFVNRVLSLQRDSPMKKFSLKYEGEIDIDHLRYWICSVLERGVLDIDLSIMNLRCLYGFPSEVLASNTLVKLRVASLSTFDFRDPYIFLPMLKTLILDSVWFFDGQLPMILSGCPALEVLDLENIHFRYGMHHPIVNLENLVEAQIRFILSDIQHMRIRTGYSYWSEDNVVFELRQVYKLFRGICNVKKLYLSPDTLQVLALCCETMPVFNNLTFLEIESNIEIVWGAMPVLLRNCPQLETLVIKSLVHCVTYQCGDACICISLEDKGLSLVSCPVKRLEIREYDGRVADFEMIKHFLEYFPCLKEMEIYFTEGYQRFINPLVPELNVEMLMNYNALLGRSRNVTFKVHVPSTGTAQ